MELNATDTKAIINEFIENAIGYLPNVLGAIVILLIGFIGWQLLRKGLLMAFIKADSDLTIQKFSLSLAKGITVAIVAIALLGQLGINTSSIVASLGVVGLSVGFAAKDTLSNIVSGFFILWDKPFVVGDLVEIGGRYGEVKEITMRSTRLATPDGKIIVFPNTQTANSMIVSFTKSPFLRLEILITIEASESIKKVRDILLPLVADQDYYLAQPEPTVVLKSINDYNMELGFRFWIRDEKNQGLEFTIRERALQALLENEVSIPYQTLAVKMQPSP